MTARAPNNIRIGSWRGNPEIATIIPVPGQVPTSATVNQCLVVLAERGYGSVLTSALSPAEQAPFVKSGFQVHEHLQLLGYHLSRSNRSVDDLRKDFKARVRGSGSPPRLRRGRRRDTASVLMVDASAFDSFWRFDQSSLEDARSATPSTRWRVANRNGIVGYAITGRWGNTAYLQRLAVHRDHQNQGIGTILVIDALTWAQHHGAHEVLVNTQDANTGALILYERLGFVRKPHGLAVLRRSLNLSGAPL